VRGRLTIDLRNCFVGEQMLSLKVARSGFSGSLGRGFSCFLHGESSNTELNRILRDGDGLGLRFRCRRRYRRGLNDGLR